MLITTTPRAYTWLTPKNSNKQHRNKIYRRTNTPSATLTTKHDFICSPTHPHDQESTQPNTIDRILALINITMTNIDKLLTQLSQQTETSTVGNLASTMHTNPSNGEKLFQRVSSTTPQSVIPPIVSSKKLPGTLCIHWTWRQRVHRRNENHRKLQSNNRRRKYGTRNQK